MSPSSSAACAVPRCFPRAVARCSSGMISVRAGRNAPRFWAAGRRSPAIRKPARGRPRTQLEIVTLRGSGVGPEELRDVLLHGGQVAGRGYDADEQRVVVGVEGESSVGAAFGEGVAVRDGDAGDRRPGAFDRAPDRAGRNGCAEAADEQQDNESFHGFGRFWVSF